MTPMNLRTRVQWLGAVWLWCALCVWPGCGEVRSGNGKADAAVDDASQAVSDAGDPTGDGGPAGDGGCARETDEAFCTRLDAVCGTLSDYDACGISRTATCGDCTAPERCGGAGTPNACAAHPSLTGVDGYIVGTTRFQIVFATDGVTSSGGFCCAETLADARLAYPDYNLVYLPEASPMLGADVIPPLTGVDGYIRRNEQGQYEVVPAIDGAITDGEVLCCYASVQEARDANPERNLAWLRP